MACEPSRGRAFRRGLVALLVAVVLAGCGRNPCREVSERLCADLGGRHEGCKEFGGWAEQPTAERERICGDFLREYGENLRLIRRMDAPPADAGVRESGTRNR